MNLRDITETLDDYGLRYDVWTTGNAGGVLPEHPTEIYFDYPSDQNYWGDQIIEALGQLFDHSEFTVYREGSGLIAEINH
tara:strand:- start:700 stop:939 length:240 start_codon:yes stop_codon:yes gene_type:complete